MISVSLQAVMSIHFYSVSPRVISLSCISLSCICFNFVLLSTSKIDLDIFTVNVYFSLTMKFTTRPRKP